MSLNSPINQGRATLFCAKKCICAFFYVFVIRTKCILVEDRMAVGIVRDSVFYIVGIF